MNSSGLLIFLFLFGIFLFGAFAIAVCYLAIGAVASTAVVGFAALFSRKLRGPYLAAAIGVLAALLALAFFYADKNGWPKGQLRYRMTVTIDTPEGIKTGSAVREVAYSTGILLKKWRVKCTGEAVVIDLGKHGVLFALMHTPGWDLGGVMRKNYCASVPFAAMPAAKGQSEEKISRDRLPPEGTKAFIADFMYPLLVRLRDPDNPDTLEVVTTAGEDGARYQLDTSKLGEGFSLEDVTIQLTEEPVTTGLVSRLPWLLERMQAGHREKAFEATWGSRSWKIFLSSRDFIRQDARYGEL